MTKNSRSLSPEEHKLWRRVTRTVKPYRSHAPKPADESPPRKTPSATRPAVQEDKQSGTPAPFQSAAQKQPSAKPPISAGVLANLDRRTGLKLKRGQMPVDGRIDLHGLSLNQAHATLAAFIRRSYATGARCIVVVTGKGRSGEGSGKIRSELAHWLNQSNVRSMVLAFTQAQIRDGGSGAFYVLLKRNRSDASS